MLNVMLYLYIIVYEGVAKKVLAFLGKFYATIVAVKITARALYDN